MRAKRILFILNHPNSAFDFYDFLFNELSKQYQLHILSIKTDTSPVLEEKGYKLHYFDLATTSPVVWFQMIRSIHSAIKKSQADMVIGLTIRNTIFGNLLSHRLGIPTISPIVGIGQLFESNTIMYRAARFLYPYALKETRHVFFYNEDDLRLFRQKNFLGSDRYSQLNGNGVDLDKFRPVPKQYERKTFVFLMISRLLYDKGIREYVEAAKIVTSQNPNVKFKIIGSFWNKNLKQNTVTDEEMKAWIKNGYVEHLDRIDNIELAIGNSDCVVLPSYREGLSNVLMEGASMEKPLLASHVPGCKELVNDGVNGFTFEARSATALANACFKLLSLENRKRKEMGKKSRELMVEKFDRRKSTFTFVKKINEILLKAG